MPLLLRGLVLGCLSISAFADSSNCGYYVGKNHYSKTTRFLFIAGVYRSGVRTYTNSLYEACATKSAMCVMPKFDGLATAFDRDEKFRQNRETILWTFRTYAKEYANKLIILPNVGMYPSMLNCSAAMNQPNLQVLALLAELAGVDLRIAVLFRSTQDIVLNSTPIKGLEADILADSAALLSAQTQLIDQHFVVPVSLKNISNTMLRLLYPKLPECSVKLQTILQRHSVYPFESSHISTVNTADIFQGHIQPINDVILYRSIFSSHGNTGHKNAIVKKTVFSETHRFIFVAGLEGSGHHSMGAIFGKRCAELCKSDFALTALLYKGASNPSGVFVYPGDKVAANVVMRRKQIVKRFQQVLHQAENNSLIMLNTNNHSAATGEISFPNFAGKNKILDHVNLHELAILAEEASVDLRILILNRPADKILTSTTVHRHFGSPAGETSVLVSNAAAMAAELQLLDTKFFLCVPHAIIGNIHFWEAPVQRFSARPLAYSGHPVTSKESRAHWLHPALSEGLLTTMLAGIASSNSVQPIQTRHQCGNCSEKAFDMNPTDFIFRRDANEAYLASMVDYLYRSAGCICDYLPLEE